MVSSFGKVQAQALASIRATAGDRVTYRRGGNSATVVAVPGSSEFAIVSNDQVSENIKSTDFLIRAEDLSAAMTSTGLSSFSQPERGDEILDGSGGLFLVMPERSVPAWEWSDRDSKAWYRIHTKKAE